MKNERTRLHAASLQSRCYSALVVAAIVNSSPPSKSQHAAPASGEKYLNGLKDGSPRREPAGKLSTNSTESLALSASPTSSAQLPSF